MNFKDFKYEGVIFKLDTPSRNGWVYQKKQLVEILQSERINDLLKTGNLCCKEKTESIRDAQDINGLFNLSIIDSNASIKIHKLWIDGNNIHAIISPMNDEMYKKLEQLSPIYFSILASGNLCLNHFANVDIKIVDIVHFINFTIVDFCLFDGLDGKFKRIYE